MFRNLRALVIDEADRILEVGFEEEVKRLRDRLNERKIDVKDVIVISPSKDSELQERINEIGWKRLDHFAETTIVERTED